MGSVAPRTTGSYGQQNVTQQYKRASTASALTIRVLRSRDMYRLIRTQHALDLLAFGDDSSEASSAYNIPQTVRLTQSVWDSGLVSRGENVCVLAELPAENTWNRCSHLPSYRCVDSLPTLPVGCERSGQGSYRGSYDVMVGDRERSWLLVYFHVPNEFMIMLSLREQAPTAASQIFAGLSFYFNGRTGDKQTVHLKSAVSKHGGRTTPVMSMRGVTHVIAENLSAIKTDKAMKSLKMKVVHPDWVKMCIAEGRLLPDAPYRVVRSQKLGVANFFCASSSSASVLSSLHTAEDECANIGGSAKQDEQNVRRRLPTLGSLTGQRGRGDHSSNLLKAASGEVKDNEIRREKGADVASGSCTAVIRDADLIARRGSYRGRDGGEEAKSVIDLSCYGSGVAAKVTDHVWPNGYDASLSSEGKGGKRSRDDACHGTPRRNRKMATSSRLTLNCT